MQENWKEVVGYDKPMQAAKAMKCAKSAISNSLNGRAKTSGGYHWEYYDAL